MTAGLRALIVLVLLGGPLQAQSPPVRFEPGEVWLHPGQRVTLAIRVDPPTALGQVWVSGPRRQDLEWTRTQDRVDLVAHAPGTWTVRALRGPGGALLAQMRVHVEADVLERVLESVRAEANDADGRAPIVVFDLDDTLFDTRWRTQATLRAFGDSRGEPRLSDLQLEDVRYELGGTLRAAGLTAGEVNGALGRAAATFQSYHWHDYQLDRPFAGAVEYVRAVIAAGAKVAYVTGRGESWRNASEAVMRDAGFPLSATTRWFKPAGTTVSTATWKGRVARYQLPSYGDVVACFDNEPANCNAFLWATPGAISVFLDTLHPADSPALASGVETIPGWN